MSRLFAAMLSLLLVCSACSIGKSEEEDPGVLMSITFEIEQQNNLTPGLESANLRFVEGNEAAWKATFMARAPRFEGDWPPEIWVSFFDSTLGGSGPATAFPLTPEETSQLKESPVGTKVVITYRKKTPPQLPSSIVESNERSVSPSSNYLEGWLAYESRTKVSITIWRIAILPKALSPSSSHKLAAFLFGGIF